MFTICVRFDWMLLRYEPNVNTRWTECEYEMERMWMRHGRNVEHTKPTQSIQYKQLKQHNHCLMRTNEANNKANIHTYAGNSARPHRTFCWLCQKFNQIIVADNSRTDVKRYCSPLSNDTMHTTLISIDIARTNSRMKNQNGQFMQKISKNRPKFTFSFIARGLRKGLRWWIKSHPGILIAGAKVPAYCYTRTCCDSAGSQKNLS